MDPYVNANRVFSLFARNYETLKRDLPIRQSEMAVLNIITQRDGAYTPLMIAELLEVTKPMVAVLIAALEEKGYVQRRPSDTDRRSFFVVPTERALSLTRAYGARLAGQLQTVERELGAADFAHLVELLDRVQGMLPALAGVAWDTAEKEARE